MKFRVAGVTFENRQEIIETSCIEGDSVVLTREPTNEYDENAVKICTTDEGNPCIGYVPKTFSEALSAHIKENGINDRIFGFIYEIHGGTNGLSYGVTVDIDFDLV